jgi:hypothetical protein
MKIDRNNYENYAIDYLDGQLLPTEAEAMRKFLAENPDLAEEISEMEAICVKSENTLHISNKQKLSKSYDDIEEINPENFDELCIAYHENDLNSEMCKRLHLYLNSHPDNNLQFSIYARLKFFADPKIHFPNKNKLKKAGVFTLRRAAALSLATAATIILFILLYTREIRQEITSPILQANISKSSVTISPEILKQEETKNKTIIRKEDKIPADKLMAPFDTNNSQQNEKVRLAQLDIIQPADSQIEEQVNVSNLNVPLVEY